MFAVMILAATLGTGTPTEAVAQTNNDSVAVARIAERKARISRRFRPKPREKLTPVEAFHRFCDPKGKIEIPKDTRPKPFTKEKPNPHKRKPRK